ncbi:trypsin-like serine protease [Hypoxylon sp. NC1633]|nr:trypsin-like serine protease [Hypoxylon sp. NC1633]
MAPSQYAGFAGIWSLDLGSVVPPAESSFSSEQTEESVFDPDHRSLVDQHEYKDGGKYRSIVKLQIRYEKQAPNDTSYAMGTGWLIRPDLLVTAGHNVYSWASHRSDENLGKAVHIKCYIGYHGRDQLNSPIVQGRLAKSVVTTAEWVTSKDNRHRDVAFIQVDHPFEGNLRLFSYKATPKIGDEMLGVVGYPADKVITDQDGVQEKGALMYEQFNDIQYNLEDPKNNPPMLKYRISTFGGQSGSPVIRKNAQQVAIATHVYGGGDKNQASVIGKFGNDYDALLSAFAHQYAPVGEFVGVQLVKPTSVMTNGNAVNQVINAQPSNPAGFSATEFVLAESMPVKSYDPEGEDFVEALRSVGQVETNVGQTTPRLHSSLLGLGPACAPVTAVAGAALSTVGSVAESSMAGIAPQSVDLRAITEQSIERAVLAEAAFQTVLKLDNSHPATKRVLGDMRKTYKAMAPNIKFIAPKLAPGLLNLVIEVTLKVPRSKNGKGQFTTLPLRFSTQNGIAESAAFGGNVMEAIPNGTSDLDYEDAIAAASRQVKTLRLETLRMMDAALARTSVHEEGAFENHDIQAAELVAKRAILGEAALQAIGKLKEPEIEQMTVLHGDELGEVREEKFRASVGKSYGRSGRRRGGGFGGRGGSGKRMGGGWGGVALDVAPMLINSFLPSVIQAVSESAPAPAPSAPASSLAPQQHPALRTKRSVLNMVNERTLQVSALGPPDVVDALAREGGPRASDSASASRPGLRRVDSNLDKPVFQEL